MISSHNIKRALLSSSNPYLTCLGPTNIKGIALSIISRLAASAHPYVTQY